MSKMKEKSMHFPNGDVEVSDSEAYNVNWLHWNVWH